MRSLTARLVISVVALMGGEIGCDSGAATSDAGTDASTVEACDFGTVDVAAYTGAPITTTEFQCTPAEANWMCRNGYGGIGALIYLSNSCDPAADERVVEIALNPESPLFTRIKVKLDANGAPIGAGVLTGVRGDLSSVVTPQAGTLSIEADALTGDCVRGSLSLTYSDYSIDGTFRTQTCPR